MDFSNKMKKLRIANGLTQKQLADSLNVSQNAVYNWENGKREPSIDMIKKIAKVFDFPLYLLLDDNFELENAELEMKRARPFKSYEMTEPPKPFTAPLSQTHNEENGIYVDSNLQKLYEVAIEKAVRHEKLTEEEEQVIIGIPGQLRPKGDDPLSYENSYSFASSEEESQFIDSDNNIHKYDATIRISPESLENLKEINLIYKKIENGEKLTENDLQTLKDYNQKQKIAMERLRETLRTMQERLRPLIELQSAYDKLNEVGQGEAAKRIEELAEIPRYTKADTPPKE